MLWLVVVAVCLVSPGLATQQRSLSQLEYVVRALEQQGRLHEVDSDLLQRINVALDRDPAPAPGQQQEQRQARHQAPPPTAASAKQSFLERARQRQLQLLGGREKVRGRGSQEVDSCGEERLEAKRLERENMRLRRRLVDLEEELELARECVNSAQVSTRHIGGASNIVQSVSSPLELLGKAEVEPSPLDKLLQGAGQGAELGPGLSLSSSLVTPDPVTSTLLSTVSSVDTVTVTHTTDLVVHYHGRAINTQLLEEEVVTSTLTSTLTSTTVISPSPTWTYLTVTQTQTQPPPTPATQQLQEPSLDQEQLALMERIRSLAQQQQITPALPSSGAAAVRAEVVEIPRSLNSRQQLPALQQYVEEIRRLAAQDTPTIVAAPLVAAPPPSYTVSTVYMSGARPGEYSTSLVTVTLDTARVRRHLQPSQPRHGAAPAQLRSALAADSEWGEVELVSSLLS